jgi:hypothetical protein
MIRAKSPGLMAAKRTGKRTGKRSEIVFAGCVFEAEF